MHLAGTVFHFCLSCHRLVHVVLRPTFLNVLGVFSHSSWIILPNSPPETEKSLGRIDNFRTCAALDTALPLTL